MTTTPKPAPAPISGGRRAETSARVVPMPFLADDDAALVQGLLADNAGAKAAFFSRYSRDVERLITHLIGLDRELADILQEVFVQALSSIRSLRDPAKLKPWLLHIAMNSARRTLRNRGRRAWLRFFVDAEEEAHSALSAPEHDFDGRETLRAVYQILDRVPADERIAFALRHIDGMELSEVASACAVSLATIKRRIERADQRFLKLAKQHPLLAAWVEGSSRWQDR